MPKLVKNTAWDRNKIHLHRVASKFIYEPSIGGQRLRKDATLEITDAQYEQSQEMLENWVKKGMIEITDVDAEGLVSKVAPRTKEPRAGASETPKGLPDEVDEVTNDVTRSQRPYIAEQLAAEQLAAEQLSADLRSTQQQLAVEQRDDGAKRGPGKKKL